MEKTSPQSLFNPVRVVAKLRRAARIEKQDADFLAKIAADTLSERLDVTNRTFETAADLFSSFDCMSQVLSKTDKVTDVLRLNRLELQSSNYHSGLSENMMVGLPETLPFEKQSLNLVTSVFGLHWSNDLPGSLVQIRNALAPDGLFLGVFPGDQTLRELRECLIEAESELSGSASLRVEPFGEVRQFGNLLQRAGFTIPVVDSEIFTVRYGSFSSLVSDLRAMGVTSNLRQYPKYTPRALFDRAEIIYREKFRDDDGKIRATFEMVFVSGWAPHVSQQKPLAPGSAKNQLKDFL